MSSIYIEKNPREYIRDPPYSYQTSSFDFIAVRIHEHRTISLIDDYYSSLRERGCLNLARPSTKVKFLLLLRDPRHSFLQRVLITHLGQRFSRVARLRLAKTIVLTLGMYKSWRLPVRQVHEGHQHLQISEEIPSICTACLIAAYKLGESDSLIWSFASRVKDDLLVKLGAVAVSSKLATFRSVFSQMSMEIRAQYKGQKKEPTSRGLSS